MHINMYLIFLFVFLIMTLILLVEAYKRYGAFSSILCCVGLILGTIVGFKVHLGLGIAVCFIISLIPAMYVKFKKHNK